MLHASETWSLTCPDLQHLRRNDRAMIRQICNVKPENVASVRSKELLAQLEINDPDVILREKRLCRFGHIERSSGAIKTVCDMQIEEKCGQGWSKMTWRTLTERDRCEWKLKMTGNNQNLDLVNMNAYIKFGEILLICSQDIERK